MLKNNNDDIFFDTGIFLKLKYKFGTWIRIRIPNTVLDPATMIDPEIRALRFLL
jgi:hypothetical protein